jgi:hypothetical protein
MSSFIQRGIILFQRGMLFLGGVIFLEGKSFNCFIYAFNVFLFGV